MISIPSNKIIIRSVYKITRAYIQPAKNPKTGRYPDCVRDVTASGDLVLNQEDYKSGKFFVKTTDVQEIYDGKEYDLDDEVQKAYWEAIQYSKLIAQERFARTENGDLVIDGNSKKYGTAEFYVERPGFEAHVKNTKKRQIVKAMSFIHNDSPDGMLQKVRLLDRPMTGSHISDVEDYLISISEKNPEKIIELYTGNDTSLKIFLLDALDKNVIFKSKNAYYYGDTLLGVAEISVINWFKNPANKTLYDRIKLDTYPEMEMKRLTKQGDIIIPQTEVSKVVPQDIIDENPVSKTIVRNNSKK